MAQKSEKQSFEVLMGWCDTQEHDKCRYQYEDSYGRHTSCTCKCHSAK